MKRPVDELGVLIQPTGLGEPVDPTVLNVDAGDAERGQGNKYRDAGQGRHFSADHPSTERLQRGDQRSGGIGTGSKHPSRFDQREGGRDDRQGPEHAEEDADCGEDAEIPDGVDGRERKREKRQRGRDGGLHDRSAQFVHRRRQLIRAAPVRKRSPPGAGRRRVRRARQRPLVAAENVYFVGDTEGGKDDGQDGGGEVDGNAGVGHDGEREDEAGPDLGHRQGDRPGVSGKQEYEKRHDGDGDGHEQGEVFEDVVAQADLGDRGPDDPHDVGGRPVCCDDVLDAFEDGLAIDVGLDADEYGGASPVVRDDGAVEYLRLVEVVLEAVEQDGRRGHGLEERPEVERAGADPVASLGGQADDVVAGDAVDLGEFAGEDVDERHGLDVEDFLGALGFDGDDDGVLDAEDLAGLFVLDDCRVVVGDQGVAVGAQPQLEDARRDGSGDRQHHGDDGPGPAEGGFVNGVEDHSRRLIGP